MPKAKLIIAVMYSDREIYCECKKDLIGLFGEIEKESDEYDFDKFTKYYAKEMGTGLVKRFIIFKRPLEEIPIKNKPIKHILKEIKKQTTEIEKEYAKEDKRRINLDPGYLSENELVLASFKKGTNYKENVGDGVYLHKVLEFKNGKIIEFWHTFPDYREKKNQEFFIDSISVVHHKLP